MKKFNQKDKIEKIDLKIVIESWNRRLSKIYEEFENLSKNVKYIDFKVVIEFWEIFDLLTINKHNIKYIQKMFSDILEDMEKNNEK